MKAGPWRRAAVLIYVAALHLLVVAALLRPEAIWRRIHWLWPPTEDTVSDFRRNTMLMQSTIDLTARPNAVWFFGDSIIHGLDTARVTERALNLGIGEDTVTGVLSRIGEHPALTQAAGIVLAVGVNDLIWRPAKAVARDYETLLSRTPAGIPVIVSAVLPVDERLGGQTWRGRNVRIKQFNAMLARLCASQSNCAYVDAGAVLSDTAGNLTRENHRGDGLHLSRAGYDILIEMMAPRVRERMPSRG